MLLSFLYLKGYSTHLYVTNPNEQKPYQILKMAMYTRGIYPGVTRTRGNFVSFLTIIIGQTPKSDIPPNIAPKIVTPENYLQIWDSSATLIGQLATDLQIWDSFATLIGQLATDLQIWDSSATLIGQLATVTIFGAMLGGIPLSGAYP